MDKVEEFQKSIDQMFYTNGLTDDPGTSDRGFTSAQKTNEEQESHITFDSNSENEDQNQNLYEEYLTYEQQKNEAL